MIKKGDPIIFGDGNNLRSMSFIDNVVQALLLVKKCSISIGKTYWIADEKPYSTIEIYRTIAELLNVKDFCPRFIPDFISAVCEKADTIIQSVGLYIKEIHVAGEMNKNIACSIKLAQRELGYSPKMLKMALDLYVYYYWEAFLECEEEIYRDMPMPKVSAIVR